MAVTQQHQPRETPNTTNDDNNGGNVNGNVVENATSTKRQRRPSVRLCEIGDPPASLLTKKPSKTPSLTLLTNWVPSRSEERANSDDLATRNRKIGCGSHSKRAKSNWGFSKNDDIAGNGDGEGDGGDGNGNGDLAVKNRKIRGGSHSKRAKTNWGFTKNGDNAGPSEPGYRLLQKNDDYDDGDGGDSNGDLQHGFTLNDSSDDDDDDGGGDDNLVGNEKGFDSRVGHNCKGRNGNDGVKVWLSELGFERYWPLFEIHEVDEDVLPFLTLEDLKDMGIHAVGLRRKMFCAIQKLGGVFD